MIPRLSYLICTTPRSGSGLLSTTLWQTGVAGHPQEYFWPEYRSEFIQFSQLGVRDYRQYLPAVIHTSMTPNGVLGTVLHAPQSKLFLERAGYAEGKNFTSLKQAIEAIFPNTKYILLTRKDKIAQAVSHYRAMMTGEWRRTTDHIPESDRELAFDQYGIKKCLERSKRSDAYWEDFFSTHNLSPLRLVYENLVDEYEISMRSVLAYLGLPAESPIPQPITKKVADERSQKWITDFKLLEETDPVATAPDTDPWAPF